MVNPIRRMARFLRPVFALDLRSLAVFRIGVAIVLLLDLACRIADVPAFLTDDGILSRMLRLEMIVRNDPTGLDYQWSLHLGSGHAWAQYLLMAVAAWFAGWLLLGYRTRLAAVLSWMLLVSLGNRNPLIYDAGDAVLRSLLFWALFLPLGARFSVDSRRVRGRSGTTLTGNRTKKSALSHVSFGSAALILQLLIVYFGAAMFKFNPVWTHEFSGVYYALNCDPFATPFGIVVREFPLLMKVLTATTFFLELGGPILILFPWWNRWIRAVLVTAFCMMHLGMAATMTLGLFPWICIVGWLACLPDLCWDRWWPAVRRRIERRWPRVFNPQEPGVEPSAAAFEPAPRAPRRSQFEPFPHRRFSCRRCWIAVKRVKWSYLRKGALQILVAGLLFYAVLWNLRDVAEDRVARRIMPDRMNSLACVLGLEKGWSMFAPVPPREDGWPIFKGILRDGTEVNLWQPDEPIPWNKPRVVSALYRNQRWRRYLENLMMDRYTLYRPYFADWLHTRWNRTRARGNSAREVVTVEILRQLETTPPPGEPFPIPETIVLWTKHYGESVETAR